MAHDASSGGPHDDLRLQPHMIPQLHQAFTSAVQQLQPVLAEGREAFRIPQPAMADQASKDFQAAFNTYTTDGPGSIYDSLLAYRQRLQTVIAQLDAIQRAYDTNETDTAAMLSRQLEP